MKRKLGSSTDILTSAASKTTWSMTRWSCSSASNVRTSLYGFASEWSSWCSGKLLPMIFRDVQRQPPPITAKTRCQQAVAVAPPRGPHPYPTRPSTRPLSAKQQGWMVIFIRKQKSGVVVVACVPPETTRCSPRRLPPGERPTRSRP